ncbi:hypothetical protein V490_05378 [Pseudogymnoascus sp. VKM F-3557]|nr:hypothetical protein V490_05378 [Pseudogymnoascus sp. VKM F-3557]
MPVPFGVGVGDFIAVGKLIAKVATELRKNGEAAPMYQSLLLELEALDRALYQLQTLQPSRHELLQLNSIRAMALLCERPLQEFLDKTSKFQPTLGTFATVRSITIAENDRAEVAEGLDKKIMAHRGLLEEVKGKMEISEKQQSGMSTQLERQTESLQRLETDAEILDGQIKEQSAALKEVRLLASIAELKTTSILSATTDILTLITSGLSTLQAIATHLLNTFELFTTFTAEMRIAMGELLQQFWSLQNTLSRIEQALPTQVHLPTIQFTDAFGDNMALPYQLCRNWSTFKELLRVMYMNRQGWSRVNTGRYLIMQARGGQPIKREVWQDAFREGDHLSMCIALEDVRAKEGRCPFPSCDALLDGAENRNGGKVCQECGRWSFTTLRLSVSDESLLPMLDYEYVDQDQLDQGRSEVGINHNAIAEDVEIYRQIYVHTNSDNLRLSLDPAVLELRIRRGEHSARLYRKFGRLTTISRKLVNPEALEQGMEDFEAREEYVIVLRVLSIEEVRRYAANTQIIRANRVKSNDDSDTM